MDDPTLGAWREIPGFPGYDCSDTGGIRTWWHTGANAGRRRTKPVAKKLTANNAGYLAVGLYVDGVGATKLVHRLVLETFVGPCPTGHVGCHWNDRQQDNRLSNLRWDSQRANLADADRNGLIRRGSQLSRTKLCDGNAILVFMLGTMPLPVRPSRLEIAAAFGVSRSRVSAVVTGCDRRRLIEQTTTSASAVLAHRGSAGAKRCVEQKVVSALQSGACGTSRMIAERSGYSAKLVYEALQRLRRHGEVTCANNSWKQTMKEKP